MTEPAWKMNEQWLEYTATEKDAGLLLEQVLKEKLRVSGRMIQRLTRGKGLIVNKKPPFLKKKVKVGDRIKVRVGDGRAEPPLQPVHLPLEVLFEDDALMVVNKPAGLMVHPVKQGQNQTLAHGIAYHRMEQGKSGVVRPVHRLDKDTSGTILFAGNGYIHKLLDQQIREREISRTYLAIVQGKWGEPGDQGTIHVPIARDPSHPVRRMVKVGGEEAITHYIIREVFPQATLVEAKLETGRTHQIRVHFSHMGHPLLGDSLYGGPTGKEAGITRQALHGHHISFRHPVTGEVMVITAPLPEDIEKLIQHIKTS